MGNASSDAEGEGPLAETETNPIPLSDDDESQAESESGSESESQSQSGSQSQSESEYDSTYDSHTGASSVGSSSSSAALKQAHTASDPKLVPKESIRSSKDGEENEEFLEMDKNGDPKQNKTKNPKPKQKQKLKKKAVTATSEVEAKNAKVKNMAVKSVSENEDDYDSDYDYDDYDSDYDYDYDSEYDYDYDYDSEYDSSSGNESGDDAGGGTSGSSSSGSSSVVEVIEEEYIYNPNISKPLLDATLFKEDDFLWLYEIPEFDDDDDKDLFFADDELDLSHDLIPTLEIPTSNRSPNPKAKPKPKPKPKPKAKGKSKGKSKPKTTHEKDGKPRPSPSSTEVPVELKANPNVEEGSEKVDQVEATLVPASAESSGSVASAKAKNRAQAKKLRRASSGEESSSSRPGLGLGLGQTQTEAIAAAVMSDEDSENSNENLDSESAVTRFWNGIAGSIAGVTSGWYSGNEKAEEDGENGSEELGLAASAKPGSRKGKGSRRSGSRRISADVLNTLLKKILMVDQRYQFVEADGVSPELLREYGESACAVVVQLPEQVFQQGVKKREQGGKKPSPPPSGMVAFHAAEDELNAAEAAALNAALNAYGAGKPNETLQRFSPMHEVLDKFKSVEDRSKAAAKLCTGFELSSGHRLTCFALSSHFQKPFLVEIDGVTSGVVQHKASTKASFLGDISTVLEQTYGSLPKLHAYILMDDGADNTAAAASAKAAAERDYLNSAVSLMLADSLNPNPIQKAKSAEFALLTDAETDAERKVLHETCAAIVVHLPLSAWKKIYDSEEERQGAGSVDLSQRMFFLPYSQPLGSFSRSTACLHALGNMEEAVIGDTTLRSLVQDCGQLPAKVRGLNVAQNKWLMNKYSDDALGVTVKDAESVRVESHYLTFIRAREASGGKTKILLLDGRLAGPMKLYHNEKKGTKQFVYDVQEFITQEFLENADLNISAHEAQQFFIYHLAAPLSQPTTQPSSSSSIPLPLIQTLKKGVEQEKIELVKQEQEKERVRLEQLRKEREEAARIAAARSEEEARVASEQQSVKEEQQRLEQEKRDALLEAEARDLKLKRDASSGSITAGEEGEDANDQQQMQAELERIKQEQAELQRQKKAQEEQERKEEEERKQALALTVEKEKEKEAVVQPTTQAPGDAEKEQTQDSSLGQAATATTTATAATSGIERVEVNGDDDELETKSEDSTHGLEAEPEWIKEQRREEEVRLKAIEQEEQKKQEEAHKEAAVAREEQQKEDAKKAEEQRKQAEIDRQERLARQKSSKEAEQDIQRVAEKLRQEREEEEKAQAQAQASVASHKRKAGVSERPFNTATINDYLHDVLKLPRSIKVLGEFLISEVDEKVKQKNAICAFIVQYPASKQAQRHERVMKTLVTEDECYFSVPVPKNDRGLSCATAVVNAVLNNEKTIDLGNGFLHDIAASLSLQRSREVVSKEVETNALVFPKVIQDYKQSKYVYTTLVCLYDDDKYCLYEIDGALAENQAILHAPTKPGKFFHDALGVLRADHCQHYGMTEKDIRVYPLSA